MWSRILPCPCLLSTIDLTSGQKSSLNRDMRLRFDFWLFCFQSQLVKARNHGGVSSDLEVSVSETLAASMIVRSQQLCLFSPLVQRLRTCRRTQLLPLLHSAGRYWKSGCFKPTSVEVITETGRTLLIFILEYRSQGEYRKISDIRHPGDATGRT